jgi:hypothetical protein
MAEPAFLAQNLGPILHVVTRQVQGVVHFVGNLGRQVCTHPRANIFAKLLFFRG